MSLAMSEAFETLVYMNLKLIIFDLHYYGVIRIVSFRHKPIY